MLPSLDELTRLQADLEASVLPDTCNILTATYASDGQGGWADTWGTATSNVKCRFDSIMSRGFNAGGEQVSGGAVQTFGKWIVTLPHDTTVTTNNRIEHGGVSYNVIGLDNDKSWKASLRVIVEAV